MSTPLENPSAPLLLDPAYPGLAPHAAVDLDAQEVAAAITTSAAYGALSRLTDAAHHGIELDDLRSCVERIGAAVAAKGRLTPHRARVLAEIGRML